MSHQSYRDESRKNWGKDSERGLVTDDQLKTGALLRIADATEAMAKRHTDLIAERDRFERDYRDELCRRLAWQRSVTALKGQITKLKKKLAQAQTQAFGADPKAHALPREDADGVRP